MDKILCIHSFIHSNVLYAYYVPETIVHFGKKDLSLVGKKDGDKNRKECVKTIGSCPGAEGGDGGLAHVCQVSGSGWGW